jgi:hypothetical protein
MAWNRHAVQGAAGLILGVSLTLFDHAGVEWFVPLGSLQAFSTAVGEFVLLKHNRSRCWAVGDFGGALVAACYGAV